MIMRLESNGIKTFGDLHIIKKQNLENRNWYEVHQLYNTFPNYWKTAIKNVKKITDYVILNSFVLDAIGGLKRS